MMSEWAVNERVLAKAAILKALKKEKGDRKKALSKLGMSRRKFYYLIEELKAEGATVPPGPVNQYHGTTQRKRR